MALYCRLVLAVVFSFWATFGLPLFVVSRLLDLINFGIEFFKSLTELIWLLIVVFPIEVATRYSWFFRGLFELATTIVFGPFVWAFNLLFNNRRRRSNNTTFLQHDTILQTTGFHTTRSRRPVHTEVDSEGLLHAEGKPAVIFDDGTERYFYHGVRLLNPRYWVHPRHWQPRWLLTEGDPDLFDILIEEIGYDRVCMELRTRTLDSWREYSLLEFPDLTAPNDFLRIVVLKMTCPSTSSVHALRVPPHIRTAREAIRWTNWGTDPEEFVVET